MDNPYMRLETRDEARAEGKEAGVALALDVLDALGYMGEANKVARTLGYHRQRKFNGGNMIYIWRKDEV